MKIKEDYIRKVIQEEIKKITENIPLPVENKTSTLAPAEKGIIIGVGKILMAASEHLRQHIDDRGDDSVHEGIRALNDAVATAIEVQSVAESGKSLDKETEEEKNRTNVKDTDLMIIATAIHDPSSNTKDEALEILNGYLKMNLHENIMNEDAGADECPEADKVLATLAAAEKAGNPVAYNVAHNRFVQVATKCEKERKKSIDPNAPSVEIDPTRQLERPKSGGAKELQLRARVTGGVPKGSRPPSRFGGNTGPSKKSAVIRRATTTNEDQKGKEK